MPGMKVTLNTAMRVRDVSKPLPHHEDEARAKEAQRPAAQPRGAPAPAPPPARDRKGGGAGPRPWQPDTGRGEAAGSRAGSGHRKGQARPAPPGSPGTSQRPQPPAGTSQQPSGGTSQQPSDGTGQRPPQVPARREEAGRPRPGPVRRKRRVRRRRRGGQAGG